MGSLKSKPYPPDPVEHYTTLKYKTYQISKKKMWKRNKSL